VSAGANPDEIAQLKFAVYTAQSYQTLVGGAGFDPRHSDGSFDKRLITDLRQIVARDAYLHDYMAFGGNFSSFFQESVRELLKHLGTAEKTEDPTECYKSMSEFSAIASKVQRRAKAILKGNEGSVNPNEDVIFNILLLSDLHLGTDECSWINAHRRCLTDISEQQKELELDLVLFVGDLMFSGEKHSCRGEFDDFLQTFWTVFRRRPGTKNPPFLCVPGNHDVARFSKTDNLALFQRWSEVEQVAGMFWKEKRWNSELQGAFQNYLIWRDENIKYQEDEGKDLSTLHKGIIPGDFSYILQKQDRSLGVVGLNSSFLHITDDPSSEMKGKLVLTANQFHAACGKSGAEWVDQRDAAIILTHHPFEWLSRAAQMEFEAQINSGGRFLLHVFGHLHEAWNRRRDALQLPSLLGKRRFVDAAKQKWIDYTHGYTILQVKVDNDYAYYRYKVRLYETKDDAFRNASGLGADLESGWTEFIPKRKRPWTGPGTS
jgi:hypothetical protein